MTDDEAVKRREAEEKASSAIKHQSTLGKAKAETDHKLAQAEKMLADEREVTSNLRRRVQEVSVHFVYSCIGVGWLTNIAGVKVSSRGRRDEAPFKHCHEREA